MGMGEMAEAFFMPGAERAKVETAAAYLWHSLRPGASIAFSFDVAPVILTPDAPGLPAGGIIVTKPENFGQHSVTVRVQRGDADLG